MRSRYLLLALLAVLGLALLGSLPSPAGETASADKINKLIEQMGSGTFAEREKATKELDAIGLPALEALRKAANSDDAEIKRRAEELVKKIEKQVESAKILAAKRVHLIYKDTPVAEAVADFQKKSGYHIYLHDPEGKLKERTITLDTGETTFWHAFELFCAKAGLVEATWQDVMQPRGVPGGLPVPPPVAKPPIRKLPPQPAPATKPAAPPPPAPAAKDAALAAQVQTTPAAPPAVKPVAPQPAPPVAGRGGVIRFGNPMMPFMPGMAGQLMLKDGKPQKLPADDKSAVRVRALAKADMFGAAPEGEIILALEVTPEPKLQWQGLQSIRIDKALDDQGQKLAQITPQVPAGPGFPGGAPAIARPPIAFWGGMNQLVPVQLKKGEKAAKSLKELKGVIAAHVLSEAKPMITADNLTKAAGKTFKGKEGGSIKIIEVKTDEEKKTTIQFEFEQPPNAIPATPRMGMPAIGGFGAPVRGIQIQPAPAPAVPPPPPPGRPAKGAAAPAAQVQVGRVIQVPVQVGGRVEFRQVAIGGPGVGIGGAGFVGPFNGITIQDDKSNALPIEINVRREVRVIGGGNFVPTFTYTFICQPGKDQGQPAKIVYLGRKRVAIDIPFTLKDVPLP